MARGSKAESAQASPSKKDKKPGRIKQMLEVYKQTQKIDPSTGPWMLGALVGLTALASLTIGLGFDAPVYGAFLGLAFGILAAMFILARKAQRAMYSTIEGQDGATLAVLQQGVRGWRMEKDPAAFDARSRSMLYRGSGRAGIALVADGSTKATRSLMKREVTKMRRLFPNVPVHEVYVGRGEGEVPLPKLGSHLTKLKNQLTKAEAGEIGRRLNAMPNPVRLAIPKGVDPMRMRPSKKALRR